MVARAYSLGRSAKLQQKQDFNAAFANGKRLYIPQGLLLINKTGLYDARVGIIIGKRNIRSAIRRNRLKRLFKEWFRLHKSLLRGIDLVLVVKREFVAADLLRYGEKIIELASNTKANNIRNPRI